MKAFLIWDELVTIENPLALNVQKNFSTECGISDFNPLMPAPTIPCLNLMPLWNYVD